MYGALYVVDDMDQYQADPEAYLADHPLPIADELLKFNRPRKEWKLEDLRSPSSNRRRVAHSLTPDNYFKSPIAWPATS